MTTKNEIAGWFDRGIAQGATHMLIVCDTFDHDDYPVFVTSNNDCMMKYRNPGEMQKVMEVYDLRLDKQEQLSERRCFNLPE